MSIGEIIISDVIKNRRTVHILSCKPVTDDKNWLCRCKSIYVTAKVFETEREGKNDRVEYTLHSLVISCMPSTNDLTAETSFRHQKTVDVGHLICPISHNILWFCIILWNSRKLQFIVIMILQFLLYLSFFYLFLRSCLWLGTQRTLACRSSTTWNSWKGMIL